MPGEQNYSKRIEALYAQFRPLLDTEDKEGCVALVLSALESGAIDIPSLYEGVIAPAARDQQCTIRRRALCIWEEHVRTSILRTVIECCYPHLMKARRLAIGGRSRGNAVIVCPTEEYHELGARAAADLFTLCGFEVTFVGANTPQEDILEAVDVVAPVFLGISVTSPYNLIAARRTVQQLVALRSRNNGSFRIIAGGQAFGSDLAVATSIGADLLAQSFEDIWRLAEGIP